MIEIPAPKGIQAEVKAPADYNRMVISRPRDLVVTKRVEKSNRSQKSKTKIRFNHFIIFSNQYIPILELSGS